MVENELSFLVKWLPKLDGLDKKEIEQDYVSDEIEPLRLRKIGGRCELSKKINLAAGDISRRDEFTVPLSNEEYAKLRGLSVKRLAKTRYYAPLPEGLVAEIDVFHDKLEGLIMVEVEFGDESARRAFVPPPWFGRDVSQETWARNSFLAGKAFDDIKNRLE